MRVLWWVPCARACCAELPTRSAQVYAEAVTAQGCAANKSGSCSIADYPAWLSSPASKGVPRTARRHSPATGEK